MGRTHSWQVAAPVAAMLLLVGCGGGGGNEDMAGTQDQALEAAIAWPVYRVQELDALDSDSSSATAINNKGQVVGDSGSATLFGTTPGSAIDLSKFGKPFHQAASINVQGQVVGSYSTMIGADFVQRPVMFRPFVKKTVELIGLPGARTEHAKSINNKPQVVGYSFAPGAYYASPVLFSLPGKRAVELQALKGSFGGYAWDINDSGRIVGFSAFESLGAYWRATLFSITGGPAVDLGILPGGFESAALAINDKGLAVGYTRFNGPIVQHTRATLFNIYTGVVRNIDTRSKDLAMPGSQALDINNKNQVVGFVALRAPYSSGFLWQSGVMKTLDALLEPGFGWRIVSAHGINDAGQIAANGIEINTGRRRALLLSPVVQP